MTKRKVNKSEKIRESLKKMGKNAGPTAVVNALRSQGIKVSPAQVSNVKSSMRSKSKRRSSGNLSLASLLEAKKLVDKHGLQEAKQAVEALAKLQ